jgi:dipeptidyl aminopeptidase/acylaminoacyl peptidase
MDLLGSKKICILLLLVVTFNAKSQKKIIDASCYNSWKKLSNIQIANDGNTLFYETNPYRGDGKLTWYGTKTHTYNAIDRGKEAQFSFNSQFIVCRIALPFDTLHQLQLNGLSKEKLPKDSLAIIQIENTKVSKIPAIISYKMAQKSNFLGYLSSSNELEGKTFKKTRTKLKKKGYSSNGHALTVLQLGANTKYQWENVQDFEFEENGNYLVIKRLLTKNKIDSIYIDLVDLKNNAHTQTIGTYHYAANFAWSKNHRYLAFVASNDSTKENQIASIYMLDLSSKQICLKLDSAFLKNDSLHTINENSKPYFADNSEALYFYTAPRQNHLPIKDTLLKEEKAVLDIWNWQDKELQTKQLHDVNQRKKETYLARIDLNKHIVHFYENDTLKIYHSKFSNAENVLAISNEQYKRSHDYDYPWKTDIYVQNLNSDTLSLELQGSNFDASISPDGSGVVYFDTKKGNYFYRNLQSKNEQCLSCNLDENWFIENNGEPHINEPYAVVGWAKGNEDVLLQSRYDLYLIKTDGSKKTRLTVGQGKEQNQEMRWESWDKDSLYIDLSRAWIKGFNQETKFTSIYTIDIDSLRNVNLQKRYSVYASISSIQKAQNNGQVIFRQSTVRDYPEVWCTNILFENPLKISTTNPQQNKYNWANVQLVKWKSYKGEKLQGLLYTPENLDPSKKYPLLVYYYEKYSDQIHNYYSPKPTASIVYPTEYASAGYIVFIPDIHFIVGHPAQSAYNCIMSGVDYVLKKNTFIDEKRMGLQGQSWGGYETAQLITMTTRFTAAMAGAPVSNMFSAYGGIRWGSGLSRQFQYEKTQSRIGASIWEEPELYVENSPLFGLPKVQTPLLIMHNDGDGSVPWYQGIELFMGLRRLNKPVWLLNYNNDEHNLMKPANRMDLSIRMRQFFDHYLQNKPAAEWMIKGVPAIQKGKTYGLDLMER